MALYINSNISSMISQRYLTKNTDGLSTSLERLSSGSKINHAGDDAAGLALSESLQSQVAGTDQAIDNIQDGINMLQIAEGGLEIIGDSLQRIRELTVQSANGTYGSQERQSMLNEINERILEISRISKTATYNKISLLDSKATSIILQIGADSSDTSRLDIRDAFGVINSTTLGITKVGSAALGFTDIADKTGGTWTTDEMRAYMDTLDQAIQDVVSARSMIGAYQNRVEAAYDNLTIMQENLTASYSRIADTDIAEETSTLARYQILQQASSSVLIQANQLNSVALSLLQG